MTAFLPTALVALASIFAALPALAADWPAYMNDSRRSGISSEPLSYPLAEAWRIEPAQAPRPAWPEPGREMHRVDYDYTFQPVVAAGIVYFGSSADDTLWAVNLADGSPRWQFTSGGPIRFAPQIDGGRCYFAGDDGHVYALDAATGNPIWSFRAAPSDRRVVGNGRMISRWPCRGGVLVDRGVVYAAAGMWPSEGVFIYAIDARTGNEIWCNDTSGSQYLLYPHGGAYALGGVAPQGYLAASHDVLLVPTGRSVPAAYDRTTGRLLHYNAGKYRTSGGHWVSIVGDHYLNPLNGGGADESIRLGESGPRGGEALQMYDLAEGIAQSKLDGYYRALANGRTIFGARDGAIEALDFGAKRWTAKHGRVYSMVEAGGSVLVGGAQDVTALAMEDGKAAWTARTPGQARGLAVADGRLVVATDKGAIVCYAPKDDVQTPTKIAAKPDTQPDPAALAAALADPLVSGGVAKGFALVLGETDARLAEALAAATDLHVIVALDDPKQVAAERERLIRTTHRYGSRVSVERLAGGEQLPYADFFANAVVVTDKPGSVAAGELYRVLRPCGGMLTFVGRGAEQAENLIGQAGVPTDELSVDDDMFRIVRGKLEGALDWDSDVKADKRVKWPLELLWFGGPGPARMIGRHWGAPTPVAASGRYFVLGERHLLAVDAYNGTELWSREFKNLFWNVANVAADDRNVYVNFGDVCIRLDAATGAEKNVYLTGGQTSLPEGMDSGTPRGSWKDLPDYATTPRTLPPNVSPGNRQHPLTGTQTERIYQRAYGCSGIISSAYADFFRSGTLGIYDSLDDSGVRNFSGIRPGCGLTMIPALGVLIANEGSAGCACSYNYQTSLALAPAHERSQEDWAVFADRPPLGVTRRALLNLGAPGDRRDDEGHLWLGVPRPQTGLKTTYQFEPDPFDTYRFNADRATISGTDRPWIYASGAVGLKKATVDLESFGGLVSLAAGKPPAIDGKLDDACWDGSFAIDVPRGGTVRLRHDAKTLYLGYRRDATIDRRGNTTAWKKTTAGKDAPVWQDDSIEAYFSDADRETVIHTGVSASGATYDGVWKYVDPSPAYNVPRLDGITIDGELSDWGDRGFSIGAMTDANGFMLDAGDFDPTLRLGWNDDGLLLLFDVRDDRILEYASTSALWIKDSLELFMATKRGSPEAFQLSVGTGADPKQPEVRQFFWDNRRTKGWGNLRAEAKGAKTDHGYLVEVLMPWQNLGIKPKVGREVAFQAMVNDADEPGPFGGGWFRAAWNPGGHAGFNSRAYNRLRLAETPGQPIEMTRGSERDNRGRYRAMPPEVYPKLRVPRLDRITIDGRDDDWAGRGLEQTSLASLDGRMRAAENFDPSLRLGWNEQGLLVLATVRDNKVVEFADVDKLWKKDSIEIFMTPQRGSAKHFQMTFSPGADPRFGKLRMFPADERKGRNLPPLVAEAVGRATSDGYMVEALLPWTNMGIKPQLGADVGLQVFINDADDNGPYPGDWFRAAWHPEGHAGWNPLAFHRLELADEASPPIAFQRSLQIDDDGLINAEQPYPWPMPQAERGEARESRAWNMAMEGAAVADETAFTAELAIPLAALADAGLDLENLIFSIAIRGPVGQQPKYEYERVSFRDSPASPPRLYTVRLHFLEPDAGVKSGQRVFDVSLNGRRVLEGLDIVGETGSARQPLVKTIEQVEAATKMTVELEPVTTDESTLPPIISAVEVVAE